MLGVIIFAAGQGTRMKSDLPKVLHTIAYKSMLSYVIDAAKSLHPHQIVLLVSPELKNFIDHNPKAIDFDSNSLICAVQHPAKGTGHAMQVAFDHLDPAIKDVIVLYGDVPFVTTTTLQRLLSMDSPCCFLGMQTTPPHAYGRMVREGDKLIKIVEAKDANDDEKAINYVWSGVLKASTIFLQRYLPKLSRSPATGEYYLTELVSLACSDQNAVDHIEATDEREFDGVNDKAALAEMEARKQHMMRQDFLEKGVKMVAPDTVFFAHDTYIENDVKLMPYVTFGKGVHIKKGAHILPYCHIEDSIIENNATIGPFAHLRGGNHIGEKASIGNFVEVKKTTMKSKSKAKHLTYLGDAEVGEGANIGAGTITCNYDGKNKFTTKIGAKSFIGANSTLIAPVVVHDDAVVGAGSVITDDVPEQALALGRSRQVIKEKK